jgi:hypothetical protein
MDELRHFQFFSKERRDPYIMRVIDYQISDTEGSILFDGHYYVLNEEFPIKTTYNMTLREKEPYEEGTTENGTYAKYRNIEDKWYEIEIYDRVKIEDTSKISEVEDDDGSPMRVCFFPTHEQKIMFRVINSFNSSAAFFNQEENEEDKLNLNSTVHINTDIVDVKIT